MKVKRIAALAVAIAMLLTVFGGCSSKNEEANNNGAKELKGTTIKVVAAYGGPEKIFAKFTEDTGINVEFLDMSSGEVLARVEAGVAAMAKSVRRRSRQLHGCRGKGVAGSLRFT